MSVLVLFVSVALTAMVIIALMPLLGDLTERQQAMSAADAAALAGVTGGADAASTLASANGGVLVGWSRTGRQVTVKVRVGDQVAIARATDEP